jgi:hypothetical protein
MAEPVHACLALAAYSVGNPGQKPRHDRHGDLSDDPVERCKIRNHDSTQRHTSSRGYFSDKLVNQRFGQSENMLLSFFSRGKLFRWPMHLKGSKCPPVVIVNLSFSFPVFCTWRLIHLKLDQMSPIFVLGHVCKSLLPSGPQRQ